MRRGKKVAERITKETTHEEVVGLIVGSVEADSELQRSSVKNNI